MSSLIANCRIGVRGRLLNRWLLLTCLTVLNTAVCYGAQQDCKEDDSEYEIKEYSVRNVKLESTFGFFTSDSGSKKILVSPGMPLKAGEKFSLAKVAEAGKQFAKRPVESNGVVHSVRIMGYRLANCDDGSKALDVVFSISVFRPSYYYSRTFELGKKRELRPNDATGEPDSKLEGVTVSPFIGYGRASGFYGGGEVNFKFADSALLKNISVKGGASPNSAEFKLDLQRSRETWSGPIRYQEWNIGFEYVKAPAKSDKLSHTLGRIQYFASTKAFTRAQAIIRFGGSAEFGRENSDVRDPAHQDLLDGPVKVGKTFVGTSFEVLGQRFKASYGFAIGSTENGPAVDFVKHIADLGGSLHLGPVDLELAYRAGFIDSRGTVPVSQRFLGGSSENEFIAGNTWRISGGPILRSFSGKDFSSTDGTNNRGGDSFQNVSSTFSVPIWSRKLIPREVWQDPHNPGKLLPSVQEGIDLQFRAGETSLTNQYLKESEEFAPLATDVQALDKLVSEVKPRLIELKGHTAETPVKTILDRLFEIAGPGAIPDGRFDAVEITLNELLKKPGQSGDAEFSPISGVDILTVDYDPLPSNCEDDPPGKLSYLTNLNFCLTELSKLLSDAQTRQSISDFTAKSELIRARLATAIQAIQSSPAVVSAETRAKEALVLPRDVLDYLIRRADFWSVGPMFIFDAARLKQNGSHYDPWRLGTGGGVKFRFIFMEISAGYVWNLHRRPTEDRGSAFFKADLIDLLR